MSCSIFGTAQGLISDQDENKMTREVITSNMIASVSVFREYDHVAQKWTKNIFEPNYDENLNEQNDILANTSL